jgi:N-acyl-D-amino-acid deacylase
MRNRIKPKHKKNLEDTMCKRGLGIFVITITAVFCFVACSILQNDSFDILITNGKIINGTGNPWFYGDVGIKDNTIIAIGNLSGETAATVIDAEGLVVAPGFIDMHTHCDDGLGESSSNANLNYLIQGTTTVRTGSCGSGTYKIAETKAAWEKQGIGTNAVLLVGNIPIREKILGDEQSRAPTPEEIKQMQELVQQAMHEGAWGISTGLEYGGYNEVVTTEEVIAITEPVAEYDGVYTSHMRDEAAKILDAIKETIRIGEATGVPVNCTHIKATGKNNWGLMGDAVKLINEARARGIMVTADQYPFIQGAPIEFITELVDIPKDMAPFAELRNEIRTREISQVEREQKRHKYVEELQKALKDPEKRTRIKEATYEKRTENPSAVARWGWHDFRIKVADNNAHLVDQMLVDIIEEQNRDGFDVVADLIIDEPDILFASGSQSEEDMRHAMVQNWVMVSSDGGAYPLIKESDPPQRNHPRDFSSQAIVLRKFVREENLLTLEDAVRKMTSLPAQFLKMKDRGVLLEGYKADITIFNPETVQDKATYANAHQYATGIEYVIVNGKVSVNKGKFNGSLNGKVLLKPRQQVKKSQKNS